MAISKADRLGKDPRTGEWMEPEKKDVWEEFDVALQESFHYVNGELVSISKTHLKDFIKTHFITRGEGIDKYIEGHKDGRKEFIVELIEKVEKKAVSLDDLLYLIKNND